LNQNGVASIIIGVTSPQVRELYKTDLVGRMNSIELTSWSDKNLEQIAVKGFARINNRALNNPMTLVQESLGSPFLMQLLCQYYCREWLQGKSFIFIVEQAELQSVLSESS